MRMLCGAVLAAVLATGATVGLGEDAGNASKDWPQWRGPEWSGSASSGASLAAQWPAGGPAKLWQSEKIPVAGEGGYSSPVVADGRVYLFANIGRSMAANAQPGPGGQPQFSNAPARDTVFCLSADDGKTLWKKEYPGRANAASSTVCVAGGKVYAVLSNEKLVCLDARTGNELWAAPVAAQHSSVLVADGLAVVLAKPLSAFDAATGAPAWTQPQVTGNENSPALWRHAGKSYLLVNTPNNLHCVALADGKLLWSTSGGGMSTAAVAGDFAAVLPQRGEGLTAYRLALDGAQKLWSVSNVTDTGASPVIANGRVYAIGRVNSACVDLQSGRVIWEGRPGRGNICSPLAADGKLIAVIDNGRNLLLIDAVADELRTLSTVQANLPACVSPALAGGKLYLRNGDGVACYNVAAR